MWEGLSVFSGMGGFDLAAEMAGIRPVAFCEIDPFCQKVLKKHWPDVPIFNDIFNLSGDDIGAVDIIYGGFPCQPFSVAGKQQGKSDSRHLWPEFSRLVGEIKPRWVFAENVPGILAIAADDVCADLERLGYEVGIWNFEAAAIGANHRRARIAFVAHSRRELRKQGSRKQGERGAETYRRKTPPAEHTSGASGFISDTATIHVQGQRDGQGQGESWRGSGRSAESRLGGMADGIPSWLDRDWWKIEPDIPRVARGIPDRVNRLKALGNAVVPAWAYPIFMAIMEADQYA